MNYREKFLKTLLFTSLLLPIFAQESEDEDEGLEVVVTTATKKNTTDTWIILFIAILYNISIKIYKFKFYILSILIFSLYEDHLYDHIFSYDNFSL